MIGYYKFDRNNIANKIKNSPKTKDGYYIVKEFDDINFKKGDILDKEYIYQRDEFKNKFIFSESDIDLYLSKNRKKNQDEINLMNALDRKLYEVVHEFIEQDLHNTVPGYPFTLNELIDTTIYIYNYKYK